MYVEIHVPAVRVEELDDETNDRTTIETHDETTVVIRHDVTKNPNFDHYLQPKGDLLYDYFGHNGKFSYGGVAFNCTDEEPWLEFQCYPSELREAAQKRAAEDWCHEVQTLAEWLSTAQGRHEELAGCLEEALELASEENPEAQYKVEYGGGANLAVDTTDGSLEGRDDEGNDDGKTAFEAQA